MGQKVEMIGKRFGRLVVLAEDKRNRNGVIFYKCFCDCGKEKVINGVSLRSGATKSCGCCSKYRKSNYCPDCGRKMEEDNDE